MLKNKRGQFYLIAAIIVVAILIGFISLKNYSNKEEVLKVSSLSEQLKIEGEKVLDYDKRNSPDKFEDFAKSYSDYAGDKIDIYYILGTTSNMEVYSFVNGVKTDKTFSQDGSDLSVEINGTTYDFELENGNNFHFIMIEKKGGEQDVITN